MILLATTLLGGGCSTHLQQAAMAEHDAVAIRAASAAAPLPQHGDAAPPGSPTKADELARTQKVMPVLRVASAPWIGSRMVPVTTEDRLPSAFREEVRLNFAEGQARASLGQMAARLTRITGVPVRIQADVEPVQPAANAQAAPASQPSLPIGAPPGPRGADSTLAARPVPMAGLQSDATSPTGTTMVEAVDMRWTGTLQGYLNHVTDRLGLAWEYRDNTVVILRYVTAYYEVATFPGSAAFGMSTGGSSSGQSSHAESKQGSAAELRVQEQGSVDPLVSIEKAVAQMIKAVPGSEVLRSDGSGRIVVRTTREMQAQVRDFIRAENRAMQRQAQIQFDIYSVHTDDLDEQGIDWNLVLRRLSDGVVATIGAPAPLTGTLAGALHVNVLSPDQAGGSAATLNRRFGDSRVIVNLLRQYGSSAQHRPVSLLALNRQWARRASLSTEGFLSETTPGTATASGVGIPGLKTDKVTTGDSYLAMPYILENNTVLLKFGISLSDLLGLFDVTSGVGATQQKVQVPRISAVSDQNTISLRPGEVVVVTGASRLVSKSTQRSLGEGIPTLAGGSRRAELAREHFMVLIRSVLL